MNRRVGMLFGLLGCSALALAPVSVFSDDGDEAAAPEITRQDLAISYLRLELALEDADLNDAETQRVNRDFDMATLAFFGRKYDEALRKIDALTASLDSANEDAIVQASHIEVEVVPPVVTAANRRGAKVKVSLRYPAADETTFNFPYEILDQDGAVADRGEPTLAVGANQHASMEISLDVELAPGVYTLAVVAGSAADAPRLISGSFAVMDEAPSSIQATNAERLDAVSSGDPAMVQAIASASARNTLLVDTPDPENTAQMMFDPWTVSRELETEIAAIEAGKNPYAGRSGDYWRVLRVSDTMTVPIRVYAPESIAGKKSAPLLVAFHGAGGDENMFMDAYGAGHIKALADEHGYLLVTPLTYRFAGDKAGPYFDLLLEVISRDYPVDPDRVYVLGHSMGGGMTATVVAQRPGAIAAAAPMCGYRAVPAGTDGVPPLMITAGALDPIANPTRIAGEVEKTEAAGYAHEYAEYPNFGHTLGVGPMLDDVVPWLLRHKLN